MNAPSSPGPRARAWRQRGAVAILFGLSIFALFGFMALVIDLGRTYVVRTELQNAADAAALAGAKQLDQTVSGVCCGPSSAAAHAIAMAAQNNFNFSNPVSITNANLWVGSCPDDSCMVPIASVTDNSQAVDKTFLKVHIPSGNLPTFFAIIPSTGAGTGTASTSTYGRAVAGRFVNNLTPIGVCAIQDQFGVSRPKGEVLPGTNELAQFGFRRGVSYNVFALGPLGAPSDTYLLNPVDVYPNACDPNNSSANKTAPFVCSGTSAVLGVTPGTVWGNSGYSVGPILASLNSRFDIFGGASVCTPSQAPPDINVKRFGCLGGSCVSPVSDWLSPSPTRQTINPPGMPMPPSAMLSADKYGPLWSYSRAVRASGATPNATPGEPFTPADWSALYPSASGPAAPNSYPGAGSPYLDVGNANHYDFVSTGKENRRVLNLAIADCPAITGSGACMVIPVLGIGRFFMQVPADGSGNPKKLEAEFAGLVDPVPVAEIKLYR